MTENNIPLRTASGLRAVERYVEFWNTANAHQQQRLAAETFIDGVSSHVPIGVMRGTEELIGFRNQFAGNVPDYEFRPRTEPETHHDRARVQWEIIVGEESFATGTDVLEIDETGRISSITGFLDRAPEGFDPHAHR